MKVEGRKVKEWRGEEKRKGGKGGIEKEGRERKVKE